MSSSYSSLTDGVIMNSYQYTNSSDRTVTISVSGMKIFSNQKAALAYVEDGSLDGMLKSDDDVDSGTYDNEIGYLHDLKFQGMMYGEQDENGFYESFEDRYTWSDYYPEYDDSYFVEVRASCEVEVKKWFGLGKSNEYKSNVRLLDTGVPYKDLEYILSLEHEKEVFGDFINEHMPETGVTVGSWWLDTLYFRIYRWDDDTESFKYGKWVRLERQGSALNPSGDFITDYGDLNKDGTWKQDTDSDYGKGKKGQRVVGSGADQESAKNDVNKKQEEQDNGGKQIDLSNTNFAELWEWFTGVLLSFWNGLGVIPDFFGRLFSFLPSPIIGFIGLGIVVAIILRVLGR